MSFNMISLFLLYIVLHGNFANAIYKPTMEYAGQTFFDHWTYYNFVDNTTWGNVTYLDREPAMQDKLTFINEAGNAIIQVDNTTTLLPGPLVNRNSIRLTSVDTYDFGSLIMIDALHIPYGCSVWPSFWTFGTGPTWPAGGEIDVIEAINGMTNNQVALHTTGGCFQVDNPVQTGNTFEKDCSTPQGCIVAETKANSYGPAFAQAGGGVYALQMETTGIYVWFWSRPDIPAAIASATSSTPMDPSTWGPPTAAYPAGPNCDMTSLFTPQQLVLLTTLCGVWAGVPSIYQSSCHTATGNCFADNVLGPPSNFDNAYWEVRYVRAYQFDDGSNTVTPIPTSTSTSVEIVTVSSQPTETPKRSKGSAISSASRSPLILLLIPISLIIWTL